VRIVMQRFPVAMMKIELIVQIVITQMLYIEDKIFKEKFQRWKNS